MQNLFWPLRGPFQLRPCICKTFEIFLYKELLFLSSSQMHFFFSSGNMWCLRSTFFLSGSNKLYKTYHHKSDFYPQKNELLLSTHELLKWEGVPFHVMSTAAFCLLQLLPAASCSPSLLSPLPKCFTAHDAAVCLFLIGLSLISIPS